MGMPVSKGKIPAKGLDLLKRRGFVGELHQPPVGAVSVTVTPNPKHMVHSQAPRMSEADQGWRGNPMTSCDMGLGRKGK